MLTRASLSPSLVRIRSQSRARTCVSLQKKNVKFSENYLLSALISLIEHAVEHHRFLWQNRIDSQTFDKMLFCEFHWNTLCLREIGFFFLKASLLVLDVFELEVLLVAAVEVVAELGLWHLHLIVAVVHLAAQDRRVFVTALSLLFLVWQFWRMALFPRGGSLCCEIFVLVELSVAGGRRVTMLRRSCVFVFGVGIVLQSNLNLILHLVSKFN